MTVHVPVPSGGDLIPEHLVLDDPDPLGAPAIAVQTRRPACMTHDVLLFIAAFLACAVEGVEAVTIVPAAAITRGWRSAWTGVAAARSPDGRC